MKVTIELTELVADMDGGGECRVWKGVTENGSELVFYVAGMAVEKGARLNPDDEKELREMGEWRTGKWRT